VCVDEKSQVQALERSLPILSMRPGIPERQTHDYARHGVTCRFAALNTANGQVTDACWNDHPHPFAWTKDADELGSIAWSQSQRPRARPG
jgi:hypothetical protein